MLRFLSVACAHGHQARALWQVPAPNTLAGFALDLGTASRIMLSRSGDPRLPGQLASSPLLILTGRSHPELRQMARRA